MRHEARSRLTKFRRVICYMKLFLDEGTIINSKPEDRDDYQTWSIGIRNQASLLQAKVKNFLTDNRQQSGLQSNVTNGKLRKKKEITTNFVATYQRLHHNTNKSMFPRLTCNHVSDMATSPSELKTDISCL